MRFSNNFLIGLMAAMSLPGTACAGSLNSAFKNGTVNGNIRAYYFTRDFETRTNEHAFSLGGALRAETGEWGIVKFGLGYYTAQDLGTNNSNPAKVNRRLGEDLEVLGEAYIKASLADTTLTLGRQKINTPFANPGDAFMIPFTFDGVSIKNKSISNLTLEMDYVNEIKNRNSDEFVDVGRFATNRFGVPVTGTSGTLMIGGVYKINSLKFAAWLYNHDELFNTLYLQTDYSFAASGDLKPFIGVQFARQGDTGNELLGEVDSTLYGIRGGASFGKAKLTLAYNSVSEEKDSFRNGAFLAPYNFSTSPLFTNNQLSTVENVDSGDAIKLTFNYNFPTPKLAFKLSYAVFDFDSAVDREATDVDVTYTMDDIVKGLSARWRLEVVTADSARVEQINHRFQLQLKF